MRSDDPEYVNRMIREDRISGSSVTIVLCGAETWKRKYVDWEIRSTLAMEHGLLGIVLPGAYTGLLSFLSIPTVPDRLAANSFYSEKIDWTEDASTLKAAIERAYQNSQHYPSLIDNSAPKMTRNR